MINRLQILHQRAFILAEILCLVTAVGKERTILAGASARIEHAAAGRQFGGFSFDPLIPLPRFGVPEAFAFCFYELVQSVSG